MNIVAIDGDVICYQAGFAAQDDPKSHALHTVNKMIENIVNKCSAGEYVVFLTGSNNFRKDVATILPYKGNRKAEKPKHYEAIREHLVKRHGATVFDDVEADDALGVFLTSPEEGETRIIATIDKDLDMVPGFHYNWRKDNLYEVSKEEGEQFFGIQMLTGDGCDNIPGLYKLTGHKATKKLKQEVVKSHEEYGFHGMMDTINLIYEDCGVHERSVEPIIHEIGTLLWMQQADALTWEEYEKKESCKAKGS